MLRGRPIRTDCDGANPARISAGAPGHLVDALALPSERHARVPEGKLAELLDRVRLARGHHKVLGRVLLQHQPHALHVVARVAPVARRVEVAQAHALLHPRLDRRHGPRDLARDKGLAAPRALVVEEDAVDGEHIVRLAVVDDAPVAHQLGARVGGARVEGRLLALPRLLDLAVQLGGGCLHKKNWISCSKVVQITDENLIKLRFAGQTSLTYSFQGI